MKKQLLTFTLLFILFILVGCNKNKKYDFEASSYQFPINGQEFKIVNFADTQMDSPDDFNDGEPVYEIIKHAIETEKPDIITFSGDNAWLNDTKEVYKKLVNRMDEFKVPYFLVFGNHDREYASCDELKKIVDSSNYGHLNAGFTYEELFGNYTIDIVNDKNVPVHRLIMMDSVDYGNIDADLAKEALYGWYKKTVKGLPCKSSIIMHIPFLEYFIVYDQYGLALNSNDQERINSFSPVGKCRKMDSFNTSEIVNGLFPVIKECDNTVNVICGHDHNNDFSILYEGVRLTYAVKTGPECYMYDETMCGYTMMKISKEGNTTTEQVCYYPTE